MLLTYLRNLFQDIEQANFFQRFAIAFFILYGTYYIPVDGRAGLGIVRVSLMIISVIVLFLASNGKTCKALILGSIYLLLQLTAVLYHPVGFRPSTFFFSFGLVGMYISMYYLIYEQKVFSIQSFIQLVVFMMRLYFVVCIIQQICLILGISYFPILNMCQVLGRGIGCNSLALEPSMFARFMLVFYYAYVKCHEYLRGTGPFTVKELFSSEHISVTIPFLWMMLTMGSGTAFVCLILFSLYFVKKENFFFLIPLAVFLFCVILPLIDYDPLQRALSVGEAASSFSAETVKHADRSAAVRIAPLLNSLQVDLSDIDTWFGRGIDSGKRYGTSLFSATLFDDYGLLFYLSSYLLAFGCAYRIKSLGALFMFLGVGGGCGNNIHYVWYLMIVMTAVRYFYENKDKLSIDRNSEEDKTYIII